MSFNMALEGVKREVIDENELKNFSDSVGATLTRKFEFTLDYFDPIIGILENRESPTLANFSVAILREILSNLDPSHDMWDKIKYAAFLMNLATRNVEFSALYEVYHQVELEVKAKKLSWKDPEVERCLDEKISEKFIVKEEYTEPEIEIEVDVEVDVDVDSKSDLDLENKAAVDIGIVNSFSPADNRHEGTQQENNDIPLLDHEIDVAHSPVKKRASIVEQDAKKQDQRGKHAKKRVPLSSIDINEQEESNSIDVNEPLNKEDDDEQERVRNKQSYLEHMRKQNKEKWILQLEQIQKIRNPPTKRGNKTKKDNADIEVVKEVKKRKLQERTMEEPPPDKDDEEKSSSGVDDSRKMEVPPPDDNDDVRYSSEINDSRRTGEPSDDNDDMGSSSEVDDSRKTEEPSDDNDEDESSSEEDGGALDESDEDYVPPRPLFPCQQCNQNAESAVELMAHCYEIHDENKPCTQCGYHSTSFEDFFAHTKTHIYTCDVCEEKVLSLRGLLLHERNHQNTDSELSASRARTARAREACSECGEVLPKNRLKEHMEVKHSKEKYKCDLCDYTSGSKNRVETHRKQHSVEMSTCEHCGKKVKCLRVHFSRSCPGKGERERETCEECKKTFVDKFTLQKHIKQVHQKVKTIQCDQCDYKTYSKFNLRVHVSKMHTKEAMQKEACTYCGQETYSMDHHIKIYHAEEHLKKAGKQRKSRAARRR